jgi:hypothetical protein
MKIVKTSLKQTSLTCPSSWEGRLSNKKEIEIHFRRGRLELRCKGEVLVQTERDQFDVSSFMDLDEALAILEKEGVKSE